MEQAEMEHMRINKEAEDSREDAIANATEQDAWFQGFVDAQDIKTLKELITQEADKIVRENLETLHLEDERPSSPLSEPPSEPPASPIIRVIKPLSKLEHLDHAVEAVREGNMTVRKASILYSISKSTLKHRLIHTGEY